MHSETLHTEAAWSKLSPRPIMLFSESTQEYIVYWGGWAMSRSQAISIAGLVLMGVYPCAKVKQTVYEDSVRVYCAGAFKINDGAIRISSMSGAGNSFDNIYYGILSHVNENATIFNTLDRKEIFTWFAKSNALKAA